MTPTARKLLMLVLLLLLAGSLGAYLREGPSWRSLLMAAFLVLIWFPVKGVLYRRLGAANPYRNALAANASSQIAGLPFHLNLALSFWPLMGVSFLASAAIESLALAGLSAARSFRRCLLLAVYGSMVVHLITAGWFASQRNLLLGIPFLLAGIVLFHIPTFFPDEWVASSAPN